MSEYARDRRKQWHSLVNDVCRMRAMSEDYRSKKLAELAAEAEDDPKRLSQKAAAILYSLECGMEESAIKQAGQKQILGGYLSAMQADKGPRKSVVMRVHPGQAEVWFEQMERLSRVAKAHSREMQIDAVLSILIGLSDGQLEHLLQSGGKR